MEQLHQQIFNEHKDWAESRSISPQEWFRRYESESTSPVSDDRLKDLNFYAYYRWYPARNQDIVVVGTNPKFDPDGPEDPVFEFAKRGGDLSEIQRLSTETMSDYFTGKHRHAWLGVKSDGTPSTHRGVFRPLATMTDYFDEIEYLDGDFYTDQIYDSIYYTNLFKFGSSPEFNDLPDPDEAVSLGAPLLKKELDYIDPEVVIMLGRAFPKLTDSESITAIHGTHQSFEGYDVIPHIHPSGYYGSNVENEPYTRYQETIGRLLS